MSGMPKLNETTTRLLVLAGALGALGFATWVGTRPEIMDPNVAYEEPLLDTASYPAGYQGERRTIANREARTSPEECSVWEVSPYAMEEVINELVRRGWRPPTQQVALGETPGITPVDPSAPVPILPPRARPTPAEPGVVDPTAPGATPPPADPTAPPVPPTTPPTIPAPAPPPAAPAAPTPTPALPG